MYDHNKDGSIAKDEAGKFKVKTSHTLNKVPFIIYAPGIDALKFNSKLEKPGLGNYAATAFNLLGYEAPDDHLPSLLTF
jgi:2,3-bisphosphoglycerate-independent phosphoglycerate mutase